MPNLFITGASSGIGEATARAAVKAGWTVGLFARSKDRLDTLAGELGENAIALPGDVTEEADLSAALARFTETAGPLNAVFANAGVGATAPGTEGGEPKNMRQMIDVNIWGAVLTAHLAIPELRKTRGHLLVTGSLAGRRHMNGSVYSGTKWFIHGWADGLGDAMRDWGGRCTIISPGMVSTPFFDDEKPDALVPDDIARAVLYALDQPADVMIGEIHVMPNPNGK